MEKDNIDEPVVPLPYVTEKYPKVQTIELRPVKTDDDTIGLEATLVFYTGGKTKVHVGEVIPSNGARISESGGVIIIIPPVDCDEFDHVIRDDATDYPVLLVKGE